MIRERSIVGCLAGLVLLTAATVAWAKSSWNVFNSPEVAFSYSSSIGSKPVAKKIAAVKLVNPDDKPDGVAPAHWEISFGNSKGKLYIFPTWDPSVKEFKAAYPTVANAAKELQERLTKKPAAPFDIPSLPWADESTPFYSQVKYLELKNGIGIRFLAEYQIEPDLITNDRLVYSLQGLSKNGKYYISALIPVRTNVLSNESDVRRWSKEEYDKFSANYTPYIAKVKTKLDKVPPTAFSPSLTEIDRFVASISVH